MKKILHIEHEYGCSYWRAELTEQEWDDLVTRWQTMKGLSCSIPVPLIIPQACLYDRLPWEEIGKVPFCHIHESYDSFFPGIEYFKIPHAENFSIGGKEYTLKEIRNFQEDCHKAYPVHYVSDYPPLTEDSFH